MNRMLFFLVFFVLISLTGPLEAQQKAHKTNFKPQDNNTCGLYSPHQLDVEHFLQTPSYADDGYISMSEVLDMSLLLGNPTVNSESNSIFLQITLTTKHCSIEEVKRPLNVCLVLDRSASMSENNRMEKLKIALKEFCNIFGTNDYLSVVVYDDSPLVLFPAQRVSNTAGLHTAIDGITLGGNTNIMAGMLAGYKEIEKNISPFYSNRLILMTDGMSTVGVTNPKEIIARSKAYNDKGIETSTIGLGADINFDLLNRLAEDGKGLHHYIGDCDSLRGDVSLALKEELESLLPIAKNMKLSISCPKQVVIAEIYGFKTPENANSAEIALCNVGQGQSKILLARLEVKSPLRNPAIPLEVELDYINPLDNKQRKQVGSIRSLYVRKSNKSLNLLTEDIVRHNYTVAYVAEELKRSLLMLSTKRFVEANSIVKKCLNELTKEKDLPQTDNFKQLYSMLRTQELYLRNISSKGGK